MVLKTAWPGGWDPFGSIDLFIILTAYLGLTQELLEGGIPVLFLGLLCHTFSGGAGGIFSITYLSVFLLCYLIQRKTNLVGSAIYRMAIVCICSMLAGFLLFIYINLTSPGPSLELVRLLKPALISGLLSPVLFMLFRMADVWLDRMRTRYRSSESTE